MVLDNFVEVEIEGKKYKLCLNNKCVFLAERELASGKLLMALADPPMSMGDMYTLFAYALQGGGNNLSDEKKFLLFIALNNEVGPIALFNIILEVVSKAGIIGKNPQAAPKA